jgi:endoglucanase
MRSTCICILLAMFGLSLHASEAPADQTAVVAPALAIKVRENRLINAAGATLQLRGVNVSGLESVAIQGWSAKDPWGGSKPDWSELQAWKVNVVRLPMNEASWLGYSCTDDKDKSRDPDPGKNYRATVEQTVTEANAAGIYVILDLQWTAPGNYCPLGQNPMADADHAVEFWTSLAQAFKNNPAVMFDLFNEPFLPSSTIGWDTWLNGGGQTNLYSPVQKSYTWRAAGVQSLIGAVRGTGATNVMLIGGVGYSNDLTGWRTHAPVDPLNQLAAAWHVYSDNGYVDVAAGGTTAVMLAAVAESVPLIITEVGDKNGAGTTGSFAASILRFADAKGYSYLAWTWNHWGQPANNLTLDAAGTPTLGFGIYFKQHLACRANGTNCH